MPHSNFYTMNADNVPSYCRKHILKSKENIFKSKCNKALRKKLKKYKLRKDGQEDPDIINVSQILVTSLRIKSPNIQNIITHNREETGENRPYNYLTKMVRLKKTATDLVHTTDIQNHNDQLMKNEVISLTPKKEQDKKQTDAFKFLMDSRNKSIGTNSPGKDRCEDENQLQKKEKNELKAKRILALNKMAQAKGSLEKLEIEKNHEENIKRKMEDRATRLKDLIADANKKNRKKDKTRPTAKLEVETVNQISQDNNHKKVTLNSETSKLKSFDLFKDLKQSPPKNIKEISKEDEEFLKLLSPSIRKKENMLCYFQKVNKDLRDSETSQDDLETDFQDTKKLIIKVKLSSKTKVKKKTNNSSLVTNGNETKDFEAGEEIKNDSLIQANDDSRPKRNSKRPVKYTDDFQLISSDEELHIFTPKKKRKGKCGVHSVLKQSNEGKFEPIERTEPTLSKHSKTSRKGVELKQAKVGVIKQNSKKDKEVKSTQSKAKHTAAPTKATKLAPIFVTKTQLDPARLEAKQNFLYSGVPSQLKKNASQQSNILTTPEEFQIVVHIQNLANMSTAKISNYFQLIDMNYSEEFYIRHEDNLFKKLLDLTVLEDHGIPKLNKNVDLSLKDIKTSYPKFPVYRTYHLLKEKSKGEFKDCIYPDLDNSVEIFNNMVEINNTNPDKLNWLDKYKPIVKRQVIGNFESIRELKSWLVAWTETNAKSKMNKNDGSDSSDFYQSDADSREMIKNSNNLLIITGAVGSGKTLSVYAVAAELAIKVIEVNASTKRTGKIMLQDLQEATQSHKVDRAKSNTESQKSHKINNFNDNLKVRKKRGRKKKGHEKHDVTAVTAKKASREITVSQENRTGMSLILIDDADIVFDQDDGFCSAISQLIQTSKRPVILVTSSLTCPHLQKFLHLAKIIKMRPFLPRMLGTWLDIMCLVDSNMYSPELGAKTLELFKGDIRKSINYLQFYVTSHKYLSVMDSVETCQAEEVKLNTDDENSCLLWLESDVRCEKNLGEFKSGNIVSKYYVRKQLQLLELLSSLNSFSIWWNLPDILNYSIKSRNDKPFAKLNQRSQYGDIKELDVIAGMLNTMSVTDLMEKSNLNGGINTTLRPWYSREHASVNDSANFATYNRSNECLNDIVSELMMRAVYEAQRTLEYDNETEINYPNMSLHRDRDRVVSRHQTLTNCLNPSCSLDRRALALDYWSLCRTMCRTEKVKTCNNSKRNNRYCHYLKSLNVLCKNDYFDRLSESLE